jgi:hypothetical protein
MLLVQFRPVSSGIPFNENRSLAARFWRGEEATEYCIEVKWKLGLCDCVLCHAVFEHNCRTNQGIPAEKEFLFLY